MPPSPSFFATHFQFGSAGRWLWPAVAPGSCLSGRWASGFSSWDTRWCEACAAAKRETDRQINTKIIIATTFFSFLSTKGRHLKLLFAAVPRWVFEVLFWNDFLVHASVQRQKCLSWLEGGCWERRALTSADCRPQWWQTDGLSHLWLLRKRNGSVAACRTPRRRRAPLERLGANQNAASKLLHNQSMKHAL